MLKKRKKSSWNTDSLCTWRGRYVGSCAADPGASQSDLSAEEKKYKANRCLLDSRTWSDSEEHIFLSNKQNVSVWHVSRLMAQSRTGQTEMEIQFQKTNKICNHKLYEFIQIGKVDS